MNQLQEGAQNVGGVIDVIRSIAEHSAVQASEAGESLNSIDQSITAIKDLSEQTVSHVAESGILSNELANMATDLQTEVNRFKV